MRGLSWDTQRVLVGQINGALHTDALDPGWLAIGSGGLDVETDDRAPLDRGPFVYDALYAWCQRDVACAGTL